MTVGQISSRLDRPDARAALALAAVTVVWGSTFVLTQDVVASMPVSSFLAWRFGIATIALIAIRPRAMAELPPRARRQAFAIGLAVSAGFALQSIGLQHTAASTSGFITGMFVVLTPMVSSLLFRERVPTRVWWGVSLAVAGLAVIALQGWTIGFGDGITLMAALAFAVQIALLSQWSTPQQAFGMTTIQMGVVTLFGVALTPLDGGLILPATPVAWADLVFLGVVASAIAFCVQAWSQAHLPATRTAVIMTGEPLWAAITGILLASDPVTARLLIGGALILAAMRVVESAGPRAADADRRHPDEPPTALARLTATITATATSSRR